MSFNGGGGSTQQGGALVVAGHDYVARSDKELSFKRGQRISVLERQESGWWLGELDGRRGLFPGTYVRDLAASTSSTAGPAPPSLASSSASLAGPGRPAPPPSMRPTSSSTYRPQAYSPDLKTIAIVKAIYDFVGDNDKKLTFKKGEMINVLQKLQEVGWWEGELNGKVGLFPSNYAEEVKRERREAGQLEKPTPAALQALPEQSSTEEANKHGETVMAICLYDFVSDEEKKLSLKKGDRVEVISRASDAWWKGRIDSRVGYFPSSYVRLVDSHVAQPPLSGSTGAMSLRGRPPPPSILGRTGEYHVVKEDVMGKRVVALYDYTARNESELSFVKGDRMKLLEDLSVNWYKGEKAGRVGRFPKNYVRFDADATAASDNDHRDALENAALHQQQEMEREREREEMARKEHERLEMERLERERLEREAREKAERELKEKMDRARQERERLERERLERERFEKERQERERAERERQEKERLEKERQERERAERERLENERLERERLQREENERLERERLERESAERDRLERERLEKEAAERRKKEQEDQENRQRQAAVESAAAPPAAAAAAYMPQRTELRRSGAFIVANSSIASAAVTSAVGSDEPVAPRQSSSTRGRPLPTPPKARSSSLLRGPAVPTAIPTGSEAPQLRKVGLPQGAGGSFSSTASSSTPFADQRSRTDSGDAAVLRQESAAVRQWLDGQDGDESQLATNFEQLRRLVLEERRERRWMAQRLAAIEERLSKLGV